MKQIKYIDTVEGEYFLCYYARRDSQLKGMFIFKMEDENCRMMPYNNKGRFLVYGDQVFCAHLRSYEGNHKHVLKVGNPHPALVIMDDDNTELYKLTEDEVQRHVLMETI